MITALLICRAFLYVFIIDESKKVYYNNTVRLDKV